MTAFYRALLRLYPASFRLEYQEELTRTWAQSVQRRGRAGAALAAIMDVVPNAIAAHGSVVRQDLHSAVRSLGASRGFVVATILVTAIGVGANVATFSVADFVLRRPLPFPDPNSLVRLCDGPRTGAGWGCMNQMPPGVFNDVATKNRSFSSLGAIQSRAFNLVGSGEPRRVAAVDMTPNVFPLLGVPAMLGRTFDSTSSGVGDAQSAVLSFGLWQTQFGGDASVIGTTVRLDGQPVTVIGVMPAHFRFPNPDAQLWLPLVLREADFAERVNNTLEGVARLRPGVTFEQARADLSRIADEIAAAYPQEHPDIGFSFFRQRDQMSPRYRLMLLALCGASLAMLLLACANLANLALARAAGRETELAVRAALGAGRERLTRQLLTESVLLSTLGGVAGLLVATAALPFLASLIPQTLPLATQPGLDMRAFALAAAFAALTGLGFGLLPAFRAGGRTGYAALRQSRGSAGRQRLRTTLVAIEVAVSVALLISSGLMIRAIWRVQAVDPGFTTDGVLTLQTALASAQTDSLRRWDFYRRVTADVRAIPGVQSAGYTSGLPMVFTGGITRILLPGEVDRRDGTQSASLRLVTSQFFATMDIPLRAGRDFTENDTRDQPLVAMVSESFARRHWPNEDPIGRVFETRGETRTVVGVVGDIKVRGLERESEPQLYLPAYQPPPGLGDNYQPRDLVVRTDRPASAVLPAIRDVVRRVDPQQPISSVRELSAVVVNQTADRTAQIRILSALAVIALLLAGVGIYGLLSFIVAQRDREIGVRLALGARPHAVARSILAEGTRMALVGVIPGVLVAWWAARGMSALLFGIRPEDPLTMGAAAAVCLLVAGIGCIRPAIRAARIAPTVAMRAE
jgi:predicted permease